MSERKPPLQSNTKSERLPSLKPKRDLTLGGVKKKVYTPTVPPRRQKKPTNGSKDDGASPSSQDNGGSSSSIKGWKDHSRREDKDMGKGRGSRRKKDVITASSVFSMGPGERIMQSRREMTTFGQMSTSRTSSEVTMKPDRQGVQGQSSTENKHQLLESNEVEPTSDDVNVFMNSIIPPIKLPLDMTSHRLPANGNTSESLHEVVVKQEPTDIDGEERMETDKPPVISSNGRVQQRSEAADVFTPSKDGRGKFLLFQLPDCLPITSDSNSESSEQDMEKLALKNVPEGAIGKIRVHSSGKVKLVLGDIVFDVTMGTRGGFLQELSSIRVSDPPSLTILGQLSHKLVCVPDISAMLYGDDDIR